MRSETSRASRVLPALALLLGAVFHAGAADIKLEPIKVKPGDTLWSISQKYLQDPKRWSEILQHNKKTLSTSDPTVALPGMTLMVPTQLIKVSLRAATLVEAINKVYVRDAGQAEWTSVAKGRLLYNQDGLRTRKESAAGVKFSEGSILNIEQDSMVVLKAPKQDDHDLYLSLGAVQANRARVRTRTAVITPRGDDTDFTARVMEDLSTEVKVYKGEADVADIKGVKTVVVKTGHSTNVAFDGLPDSPIRLPEEELELAAARPLTIVRAPSAVAAPAGGVNARVPGAGDAANLEAYFEGIRVGEIAAAYHIQISNTPDFKETLFDQTIDAFDDLDLNRRAGLTNGAYWVRVSVIDLLGERGKFSAPLRHVVGDRAPIAPVARGNEPLIVTHPEGRTLTVPVPLYYLRGYADPALTVAINGIRVPNDETGFFTLEARLKRGPNDFRIVAEDVRGEARSILRTITYSP